MNPTSVSVSIRYSKTMQDGSHKTVELSVEGTLSNNEPWKEAQVSIYKELGENMRYVFASNGTSGGNGKHVLSGVEGSHAEIPPAQTAREHWCSIHQTSYKRFAKGNNTWWSHRDPQGAWCKEQSK
jgi:hypothetical protein